MHGVVEEDELEEGEIRGCGEVPERVEAERGRLLKEVVDPRRPSVAEVEAHWRGNHGSYRNWCPICVKARGKDLDHRADTGEERGLSEYAFDYALPGDEFGHQVVTLVGSERKTGAVMATAVPMKGSTGRFSVDKVLEFMDEVGDQAVEVIVKSDQEAAIVSGLIDEVVEAREAGRTIKEESPKYSKGSN